MKNVVKSLTSRAGLNFCMRQCRIAKFHTHFIKCTITGISGHLEAIIEPHVTSLCRAATRRNSEKESRDCAGPLIRLF
jgi:hypothetical protein